ncbi:Mechanosensitive ion channel protein [Seminavis robusta]|uniref:Mechanosensitive ion channel protein n=1 Tax=Seminavis robusta TaxID=568900 RepID=A0A9N8EBW6_9STRA|nr:Mechanosensitive ion channel protein [Seminavis robusta]|eukprot:Sro733_g194510.1 Mechanosensitive ion channel protein (1217) ;mRNA; r:8536-12602
MTDDEDAGDANDESISTITDSVVPAPTTTTTTGTTTSSAVDGTDFLTLLRAAGGFGGERTNDDTWGFSEQQNNRHDLSTLSRLFDSSNTLNALNNEDTVGRSNRTNQQRPKKPQLASLAELFEPPPGLPIDAKEEESAVTVPEKPPVPAPSPPPPQSVLKNPISPLSGFSGSNDSIIRNATTSLGLPPRPPRLRHHQRTVSWGNNTTFVPPTEEQPQEGPDIPSQNSFDSVSSLDADAQHRRNNTRTQFLGLDDLLSDGPYEAEAESNIIRAMEAQRARVASPPPILPQVPSTAVHDFLLEEEPDEEEPPPPVSFASRERAKLLHNSPKKVSRHQRHLSVEQTLAGLTNAMSAFHGTQLPNNNFSSSSADAFANNAARLSEQQEESPHHHRPAPSRVWQFDNLPIVEEDDRAPDANNANIDDDVPHSGEQGHQHSADIETGATTTSQQVNTEDHPAGRNTSSTANSNPSLRRIDSSRRQSLFGDATDNLKTEWEAFSVFFRPRKKHVRSYVRNVLLYIVLPLTGIAGLLYYVCGNPIPGAVEGEDENSRASASWWLLFTVREVITFSMALAMQGFLVDFLALGTKVMLRLVGPVITLLIVQAKGWPFICFWWAIFDFAMQASGGQFSQHWLYWSRIGLFNASNPSGNIPGSESHIKVLSIVVSVSVVVAVKRFLIGLYLGRQTFSHYGESLAKVMNSMLLVSEVAGLAKAIEKSKVDEKTMLPVTSEAFGWEGDLCALQDDDNTSAHCSSTIVIDTKNRDPLTGSLPSHEKRKLMQLLGQWEEPTRPTEPGQIEIASISAVLRFRKALTFMQTKYPFGYFFGDADTREKTIESAQKVYNRLLLRTPGEQVVQFETLALLALEHDGSTIDQQKAKELLKLFRPDREGRLSMVDFLKSVDSVYKECRMLNASIQNSSQIDRAFENIFNVVFYIAVVTIALSLLGFNPLALFLSLSSVILGFAFMIGSASSKYFEGVLFILVRRPYGIGDRIHISGVELDTSIEGSPGWVVENVTLFETIATWTPTKERCSLSNGSLANSRIINAARSPQAQFHIFLKFPIDTSYERTIVFKNAIEEYMKSRPREWLALNGFRAFRIAADLGYVEYAIVIQHRESWQEVGQILDSKANLSSYCNEVAKQLNMHYRAPPLPVDLRYITGDDLLVSNLAAATTATTKSNVGSGNSGLAPTTEDMVLAEMDREAQMNAFRQIAMSKHNIRLN